MNQMCNAKVLLGSHLIRQRWLSSGYVHTAEFNCLKMAMIVSCLVHMHNSRFDDFVSHLPEEEVKILESLSNWKE